MRNTDYMPRLQPQGDFQIGPECISVVKWDWMGKRKEGNERGGTEGMGGEADKSQDERDRLVEWRAQVTVKRERGRKIKIWPMVRE